LFADRSPSKKPLANWEIVSAVHGYWLRSTYWPMRSRKM